MSEPSCDCDYAGWCERHGVVKDGKLYEACKAQGAKWLAWETGRGPLQPIPPLRKRRKAASTSMPIPIKRIRRGSMNHKLREASILDETDLARDSVALAGFIAQRWPEVDGIAGVPRSGMIAGSIVATTLGVPLYELYQGQLRRLGGGRRMRRHLTKPEGTSIVAVEDSINTGWSMGRAVSKTPDPRVIGKTAVYCTPTGTSCVDLYAVALPLPHYFTWHMFGANVLCRQPTGFDMDGIYCTDCEREDDDDGERYLNWMRSVRPYRMYVGGKATAIVTSRLEKYRDETVQWFARYGLEYGQLVMGPWASLAERRSSDVGAWKASVARDLRLEMFVESSERQARSIAALAQIPVFCPKTKSIYTP